MNRISRFGGVLVLALGGVLGLAGFCLAAEYRADMSRQEGGREIRGRLLVAGPKIRLEMTVDGQEMVTLIDREQEKLFLLRPRAGVYIEKPYGAALSTVLLTEEGLARIGRVERLGEESLDGFECDKIKVVYNNPQNGEATIWRARKLDFPIQIISQSSRGETIVRYTNVEFTSLGEGVFELPKDYRQIAPRSAPAD